MSSGKTDKAGTSAQRPEISKLPSTSKPKENVDYSNKGNATEKTDMSGSKYEFICKVLAVVIVFVAFISHLLRGTQEGRENNLYIAINN